MIEAAHPAVVVRVPSSKSVTHRAFVLAARAVEPCVVEDPLLGADCRATLAALAGLGARFTLDDNAVAFAPVAGFHAPQAPLDCANSGTTLRLMTAQAALGDAPVTLTGDASLRKRPNGPLLSALAAQGVAVQAEGGRAPLTVCGPLRPGAFHLGPRVSSQYASALLLATALLPGDSAIHLARPVDSRPYLDLTLAVAGAFGLRFAVEERREALVFGVAGGQRPSAARYAAEGDWSGAAFPLLIAALHDRPVELRGLRRDSVQGDRALAEMVPRFGPHLAWTGDRLRLDPAPLHAAGEISLAATPDLFPPLVALAAVAPGLTVFTDAPGLRHKECDRIAAMAAGLAALGIEATERPDGLIVNGGRPRPGSVHSHDDHRVHMAFAALAARFPGIAVDGRGCEAVSYPGFHADLARITG